MKGLSHAPLALCTNGPAGRPKEDRVSFFRKLFSREEPEDAPITLDLVFEVRPVFTGPIPPGMESIGPLQDEVIAAAADLRELLPGEKG